MFKFILYAIIIYLIYLAIKWAYKLGTSVKKVRDERKKFNRSRSKIDLDNIEDAEFTEVKSADKDKKTSDNN